LENIDTKPTPYYQFDFSDRRRHIKKWMGYRGVKEWEINQRLVSVTQSLTEGTYIMKPCDNYNIHPWIGAFPDGRRITLEKEATTQELGKAVLDAFKLATYHPDRKME
jgi:hypothetical protein